MAEIETSTVIWRPVDEVWQFISDPENTHLWAPAVLESTSDGPLRIGARGREVHKFMGRPLKMDWEVTNLVPGQKYAFRYTSGPLPATVDFTFEPVPEGTRVVCRTKMEGRGLMRILMPLVTMEAKEEDKGNFVRLKRLLEERAA